MAVTHGKIAKLEATVASLRQDYHFLEEKVRSIEGKNAPLEAKVKALMHKNQNLQIKVLGRMDTLRERATSRSGTPKAGICDVIIEKNG